MPDKPKRRKNKNKRKNNKNNSTDVNKNNINKSEPTSASIDESCSSVTEIINKENVTCIEKDKIEISDTSEVCESFKLKCKSDTSHEVEFVLENNEVVTSTTEDFAADNHKTLQENSSVLDQHEKNNTESATTSEVHAIPSENLNDEVKEKEDIHIYDFSKHSMSNSQTFANNVIEHTEETRQTYIVETPDQAKKIKCKLENGKKSKSFDNDDCPTIVEVTDDSSTQSDNDNLFAIVDNSNVIISGEESDIEWEKVDHFNLPQTEPIKGVLSSDTISLNIVHCEQIKSLSAQEELSLRNYLQTLNLSTSSANLSSGDIKTEIEQIINREIKYRLRKKGLTEDNLFIRAGPSRSLAVIDEEGSGDSSKTSRRHSYLSDKKSDNEDLEDDVFESKPTNLMRCMNTDLINSTSNKRLIPQPCIRVGAKLKEPEISEARGDWSIKTVEKMTGAELVYLTDSSSSTSSIYDANDDADQGEETDVSIRMITPTIEVTDTESLLSNTFLPNKYDKTNCENVDETILNNEAQTKNLNNTINDSNSQHDSHEIVILCADNIKTNLVVKDVNESSLLEESEKISDNKIESDLDKPVSSSKSPKEIDAYDLEIKVLKCELNDAINNLIKEVISDSENNKEFSSGSLTRQDSSSSVGSSQCTAKYNPTHSSLNDVSNILQDDSYDNRNKESPQRNDISSHVKDVLQCITSKPPLTSKKIENQSYKQPFKLRDICLKKIATFPFGDKILEELAHVSLRLQNMSTLASERSHLVKNQTINLNSHIDADKLELNKTSECKSLCHSDNSNIPPPILPRKSSLKINQDEAIKYATPKTEVVYECLSPSQKMLMEKTNTIIKRDFKSQPNVNIVHSETNDFNKNNRHLSAPTTPMKSETGSRLLALLRDTSISQNFYNKSLEDKNLHEDKIMKPHSETFSKRLLDEIDSTKNFKETTTSNKSSFSTFESNSFKPIPPPKPKKISTYFYESDENSDFRENSFRSMYSNKKHFHYSTGNLNKEIENDISSIQNMHRYCTNIRDRSEPSPRRPSLPKDLCEQQMDYIRQKEKEVDAELRRLEQEKIKLNKSKGPRAPMVTKFENNYNQISDSQAKSFIDRDFMPVNHTSKHVGNNKLSSLFSSSQEELLREKMYSEYVNQMAEREQRKQHRVIKVTQTPVTNTMISKSMPLLDNLDSKVNNRIEQEFISKARERWYKLGIRDPETEDEKDIDSDLFKEPTVIEHKIKVIEAGEEKDVNKLPSHMQEFVQFTVKDKEEESGSTGESDSDQASAHVVVFCAVVILVLTVGKFLLQLLRNK